MGEAVFFSAASPSALLVCNAAASSSISPLPGWPVVPAMMQRFCYVSCFFVVIAVEQFVFRFLVFDLFLLQLSGVGVGVGGRTAGSSSTAPPFLPNGSQWSIRSIIGPLSANGRALLSEGVTIGAPMSQWLD